MTSSITPEKIGSLYGRPVYDPDGAKVGSIGQIYTDTAGQPGWASVNTGLFGIKETLVPLYGARVRGDNVEIPYEKATVKDAPNIDTDPDEPLASDQVEQLYQHYHLTADEDDETAAASPRDDAMTRSQERMRVGTSREQTGRARLRKYVVTENQQVTVPVSHEEVRLEREPITDANAAQAYSGPELTESEHETSLYAERPVVDKETVPVERVRLAKDTVTDSETVEDELRSERIEADLPGEGRRRVE